LSYGGGISKFEEVQQIFKIGFEKVVLNTSAIKNPNLITKIAEHYGSQAIVISVDYKSNDKDFIYIEDGNKKVKVELLQHCQDMEDKGAGEILLTAMDKEGTWGGYDIENIRKVSSQLKIPVIANAGCGNVEHIFELFTNTNAQAAAIGSMFVYQKKDMGVLVNIPNLDRIKKWVIL
jgi:cyclase